MKAILLIVVSLLQIACTQPTKKLSSLEVWKLNKACQFYHDIHPEEDLSKYQDCKDFILENNPMPKE